jgi:hypothetical protein
VPERWVTACHEAGHAVAACALGFRFARVSIAAAEGSAGRIEGLELAAGVGSEPEATEEYLVYLYAGAAAVREFCGGAVTAGRTDDRFQAEQCAGLVFREVRSYRECLERSQERSRELIRARRETVEAVSTALLVAGELSFARVSQLMGKGAPGPTCDIDA